MRRNTDPAFKGVSAIKGKQRETLEMFKKAAARSAWMEIHQQHYDWWMFPIDEPSAYGMAWTVYEGDIAEPIRLYKAAKSVQLFGFTTEFASLRSLGQELIRRGESMYYRRDLSGLFQ